jgi:hypothetical protein
MWTTESQRATGCPLWFQSLSRDSVHVDWRRAPDAGQSCRVSIPQSGFGPCGHVIARAASTVKPEFQSLSRDSVHVDLPRCSSPIWVSKVSIPQSGFGPCGRLAGAGGQFAVSGMIEDADSAFLRRVPHWEFNWSSFLLTSLHPSPFSSAVRLFQAPALDHMPAGDLAPTGSRRVHHEPTGSGCVGAESRERRPGFWPSLRRSHRAQPKKRDRPAACHTTITVFSAGFSEPMVITFGRQPAHSG